MSQQSLQMSDSLKSLFLIEFTKELIRNSKPSMSLEGVKRTVEIPRKIAIQKKENAIILRPSSLSLPQQPKQLIQQSQIKQQPLTIPKIQVQQIRKIIPNVLRIPETHLPETFGYLKPIPIALEIDLGKLNDLAKDPSVRTIECNGPDEQVVVEGRMGRKVTGTILTKEEIEEIIGKFSQVSKIPISTGIYRVVAGRLLFSAIISEIVNSKFIIKKL
jgi:hypothetical protein